MRKSTKSNTKTTVQYGKVRKAFVEKSTESKPAGVKAGRAARGAITVGAATVVAGLGVAVGAVAGFARGFFGH